METHLPEVWLLFPHYDGAGRRSHTLLHVFISNASYYTDTILREQENIDYIIDYIRRNVENLRDGQEVYVEEPDLLRYIIADTLATTELLVLLPAIGGMQ